MQWHHCHPSAGPAPLPSRLADGLSSVYLRHDIVGRGVGRLLLAELIARCEALGLRQMVAVVGDSANVASVRLHEAFGFRLIGTLTAVGRKHGRWLDTVLLQRALGEGDRTDPAEGE